MKFTIIATGLIALGILFSANASALSCKNRLITEGDPLPRVLSLCGEPSFAHTYEKEVTFRTRDPHSQQVLHVVETVFVDEWTYNFGPRKLIKTLTFHNGLLHEIDVGKRGYSSRLH